MKWTNPGPSYCYFDYTPNTSVYFGSGFLATKIGDKSVNSRNLLQPKALGDVLVEIALGHNETGFEVFAKIGALPVLVLIKGIFLFNRHGA